MAPSPNEEIWSYLEGLPEVLRAVLLGRILGLYQPQQTLGATDLAGVVRTILFATSPMQMAGAAVLMAGAIDHILAPDTVSEDAAATIEGLASEEAPDLTRMAAHMRIADALLPAARHLWKSLRSDSLSPGSLHRFQITQADRALRRAGL